MAHTLDFGGVGGALRMRILTSASTMRLSVHASGRYFVDATGEPVLIHGDTAWSGIANLSASDAEDYLDDCQARGFNALIVNLIEHEFSDNAPNNIDNDAPFTGTAFQSSLGTDYFANALAFVRAAAARGIYVFLNPCYLGFNGEGQGWYTESQAADNAEMEDYGELVGDFFADEPNVVYHLFGDFNPPSDARVDALRTGILSADPTALFGAHFGPGVDGHDVATSWAQDWDWIYQYGGFVHEDTLEGYDDTPTIPVLFVEGWYEGENSSTALDIRRQAWGSVLSGAIGGQFYGHRDIWGFGNGLFQGGTWQAAIANTANVAIARTQMAHLRTLLLAHAWHLLEPDATSTFITAGRGTLASAGYVTAALASDGSCGFAYLPTGSTGGAITVDKSEFSGAFNWHWLNPRTGATSGGATGVANTGTMDVTAPDSNDWVFVGWVP